MPTALSRFPQSQDSYEMGNGRFPPGIKRPKREAYYYWDLNRVELYLHSLCLHGVVLN
jgi:hypothetical protein